MSTNVIKWSTQSNQRTVAFRSCVFCLGIPHTCLHKTPEIWVRRGGISDNFPSAYATSVFIIGKYWQMCRSDTLQYKSSANSNFHFSVFDIDRFDLLFHCRVLLAPRVPVLLVSVVSLISWETCIASSSGFELAQAQVQCLWYLFLDPLHLSDQCNVLPPCLHQQVILSARVLYRPLSNTSLISHNGKKVR